MLNFDNTTTTVIIRGLYTSAVLAAGSLLTTYQVTGSWEDALLVAGITGLGALGYRSGVEGLADIRRDRDGIVLPGDVGQLNK